MIKAFNESPLETKVAFIERGLAAMPEERRTNYPNGVAFILFDPEVPMAIATIKDENGKIADGIAMTYSTGKSLERIGMQ